MNLAEVEFYRRENEQLFFSFEHPHSQEYRPETCVLRRNKKIQRQLFVILAVTSKPWMAFAGGAAVCGCRAMQTIKTQCGHVDFMLPGLLHVDCSRVRSADIYMYMQQPHVQALCQTDGMVTGDVGLNNGKILA